MTTLNVPCVQPFDTDIGDSEASIGSEWGKWLIRFENYMSLPLLALRKDRRKYCCCMQLVPICLTFS